jgi:hypothetical protein
MDDKDWKKIRKKDAHIDPVFPFLLDLHERLKVEQASNQGAHFNIYERLEKLEQDMKDGQQAYQNHLSRHHNPWRSEVKACNDSLFHGIKCLECEDGRIGFFKSEVDVRPSSCVWIDIEDAEKLYSIFWRSERLDAKKQKNLPRPQVCAIKRPAQNTPTTKPIRNFKKKDVRT